MLKLQPRRAKAFTLVELLVVIGIITILVSALLPTLARARFAADKLKCSAGMKQIYNGFLLYECDSDKYWPCANYFWTDSAGVKHNKLWQHHLSKYLLGKPINEDGSDILADRLIKDTPNVLWGCPNYDRLQRVKVGASISTTYNSDKDCGYAMNYWTFAPGDVSGPARAWRDETQNPNGNYYRACKWKNATNRALVCESMFTILTVPGSWTWSSASPMPSTVYVNPSVNPFSLDFNRHNPRGSNAGESQRLMNMLYCDGHVEPVSAREAYRAIRFK